MDQEWGRARAIELLDVAASWLADEARDGQWHTLLARHLGALATIAGDDGARGAADKILEAAPAEAFLVGVITNIDPSSFVVRQPPTGDELERWYPAYGPAVVEELRRSKEPHIKLVLDDRIDDAWRNATTDLFKEECAATCAVVGDLGRARRMLDHAEFPTDRQDGPLMAICIESCRRDDSERCHKTLEELQALAPGECWMQIHLAAGFLGRVPWGGYPFPDY